jgi:hypothetical protein
MEKCIDFFSRLLIATITFVVPIIINLLSSFAEGEKRRKELSKMTEEALTKQAAEEMQTSPETLKQTITKTHIELQKNEFKTKKELELLNPITQFWKIFAFLIFSFCMLGLNYLIRANQWGLYVHIYSILTMATSILGYLVALFFIIRILYTISKTRRIV